METEFTNVAHLYLGCSIMQESEVGSTEPHIEKFVGITPCCEDEPTQTVIITADFYEKYIDDIKPILRPLSDMTDEEASQIFGEGIGDDKTFSPDEFVRLLSMHFDLFGLIESGAAIDATTLK